MKPYTFDVTKQIRRDVVRAITFEYYPLRRVLWMSLLVLYLSFLIGITLFIYASTLSLGVISTSSVAVSILLAFAISFMQTSAGITHLTKMLDGPITVTAGRKQLTWGTLNTRSEYAYYSIRRVVVRNHVALVFISNRNFLFFPVDKQSQRLITAISKKIAK